MNRFSLRSRSRQAGLSIRPKEGLLGSSARIERYRLGVSKGVGRDNSVLVTAKGLLALYAPEKNAVQA
jgi:hypothetical protein